MLQVDRTNSPSMSFVQKIDSSYILNYFWIDVTFSLFIYLTWLDYQHHFDDVLNPEDIYHNAT